MSQAHVKVEGLEAVQRAFEELEPKLARKVVRQAERKALGIPYDVIKIQWPELSGSSRKSIRIRASKGPRGGKSISMALLVGAAGVKGKVGDIPYWTHFTELGFHTGSRIRVGRRVVGRSEGAHFVEGQHILKRTLQTTEARVQALMAEEIIAGIEREAKS